MRPPLYLLAAALILAALLTACAEPGPDPAVLDPAASAPPDTVLTPLAVPDPGLEGEGAVGATAEAALEPVGGSGVRGQAQLHQTREGLHLVAEVGGGPEGARALRVLARRDCTDPADTRARSGGNLGAVEEAFDGAGRYERTLPGLRLEGEDSVVGHALAVVSGAEVLACGVIRSAAR